MPTDAGSYIRRHEQLRSGSSRANFESYWQQIAEVVWPDAATFTNKPAAGTKRTQRVFDSTATRAVDRHSALMMALNTPPTQRWQVLRPEDPDLAKDTEASDWLESLSLELFRMRDAKQANFYGSVYQVYKGMGTFGTAVLFVDAKPDGGILYKSIPLSEICVDVNSAGIIDTVYRKYPLSARQAMQRWPDKVGDKIKSQADTNPWQMFDFLHVVMPNDEYDPERADAEGKLFKALEISLEDQKLMETGGYEEMPYMIPRFSLNVGEFYGRSPAMSVLPDILTLNEMAKTFLKAGHKAVDPPILLSDDNVMGAGQTVDLRPGAYNYGGIDENGRPKMMPFVSGVRLDLSLEMMERLVRSINEAFMVMVWEILIEKPDMTATEVMIRAREKGQILTPLVAPVKDELLDPCTDREIGIVLRQNARLRSSTPAQLEGQNVRMFYQTESTRLQRTDELMSVRGLLEDLAPFAATNPALYEQVVKPYELARLSADVRSVPRAVLVSDEEREEILERQQAANEEAQMIESAPGLAKGLKDAAEAGQILGTPRAA